MLHDKGVANLLSSLDDHNASDYIPDGIPTTLLKNLQQSYLLFLP